MKVAGMVRRIVVVLMVVGSLVTSACVSNMSAAPAERVLVVHVSQLKPVLPRHLIAHKIPRELLIVVDRARVPTSFDIYERGIRMFEVLELQEFARRDVAAAFAPYFDTVRVVEPGFEPPSRPYAVADVEVQNLRLAIIKVATGPIDVGQSIMVMVEITWSLALRLGEDVDYTFSYAGRSQGDRSMSRDEEVDDAFRSAFEAAISDMLKTYVARDIQNSIMRRRGARPLDGVEGGEEGGEVGGVFGGSGSPSAPPPPPPPPAR